MQMREIGREEKKRSEGKKHLLGLNPCQDLNSKRGKRISGEKKSAIHRIELGSHR